MHGAVADNDVLHHGVKPAGQLQGVLVAVGKLGCAEQLLAHGLIALKVGVYRLADLLQGEFPAPEYELIQGGERFDQGADANDIHRTVVDIQAVVPVTGLVQILHVDPAPPR